MEPDIQVRLMQAIFRARPWNGFTLHFREDLDTARYGFKLLLNQWGVIAP